MEVHVQYQYIKMSPDSYIPLPEPHLNICILMGAMNICEKAHVLRHISEHTCASTIYYQVDLVMNILLQG